MLVSGLVTVGINGPVVVVVGLAADNAEAVTVGVGVAGEFGVSTATLGTVVAETIGCGDNVGRLTITLGCGGSATVL